MSNHVSCNRIQEQEFPAPAILRFDDEFDERSMDDQYSQEDSLFLNEVQLGTSFAGGHYCISLPTKDSWLFSDLALCRNDLLAVNVIVKNTIVW